MNQSPQARSHYLFTPIQQNSYTTPKSTKEKQFVFESPVRKNSKNKALITKVLFASAQSKKLEFENVKDDKWEENDDLDYEIIEQEENQIERSQQDLMNKLLYLMNEKQGRQIFSQECQIEVLNKWWVDRGNLDQNMNQILNYVYLVDLEDVQYDYDEAIVSCKVKVINSKGDAKTANISIREQDQLIREMKIRFF